MIVRDLWAIYDPTGKHSGYTDCQTPQPEGWTLAPVDRQHPPLGPYQRYPNSPASRTLANGVSIEVFEPRDIPLAEIQTAARDRINREAGEQRARHVTVTTGQEGTYLEKAREARACLADPDPQPASYPYLAAEAEATGATLAATAAEAWTALNAAIEGRRRGALVAIEAAATPALVEAVFPITWPSPA